MMVCKPAPDFSLIYSRCENTTQKGVSDFDKYQLHIAVCRGSYPSVSHLLNKGYDPNLYDSSTGRTPVHCLAFHFPSQEFDDILTILVQHGGDVNYKTELEYNNGYMDLLGFCLLKLTLQRNTQSRQAINDLEIKMCHRLFECGARVMESLLPLLKDTICSTHYRPGNIKVLVVKLIMLSLDPTVNWKELYEDKLTVLHCMCLINWITPQNACVALQAAMTAGVDVNQTDSLSRTPLYLATFHGNANFVKALLDQGANINIADQMSLTALDIAELGIKSQPDNEKIVPFKLKYIEHEQFDDIIAMLSEYTKKLDVVTNKKKWTLPSIKDVHHILNTKFKCIQLLFETSEEQKNRGESESFKQEAIDLRGNTNKFIQDVLTTPGLGVLPHHCTGKSRINQQVELLVGRLASLVEKEDTLFKCTPVIGGSVCEQTKVGFPNEFDYRFNLTELQNCVIKSVPTDWEDSRRPVLVSKDKKWKTFSSSGQLDHTKIAHHFNELIVTALGNPGIFDGLLLTRNWSHSALEAEAKRSRKFCTFPIILLWMAPERPGMCITIDIVLAVNFDTWPPGVISPLCLLLTDEEREQNCCAILKEFDHGNCWFEMSTCKMELSIMSRIPRVAQLAYMLCKVLIDAHYHILQDRLRIRATSSYRMKTALFYLLEARQTERGKTEPEFSILSNKCSTITIETVSQLTNGEVEEVKELAIQVLQKNLAWAEDLFWDMQPYILFTPFPDCLEGHGFASYDANTFRLLINLLSED